MGVRRQKGPTDSYGKTPPAASEDVDLRGGRIKTERLVGRVLEPSRRSTGGGVEEPKNGRANFSDVGAGEGIPS